MNELDAQVRDAIFTLRDVRDYLSPTRLDLVALPPRPSSPNYLQAQERFVEARQSCQQIKARFVVEDELPEWSEELAQLIEAMVARSRQTAALG